MLRDENGFCHMWITQSSVAYESETLNTEKLTLVEEWVNALSTIQDISENLVKYVNVHCSVKKKKISKIC